MCIRDSVTSFQQWPTGVEGQTYQFVQAEPSQANNLEYQSYQDMVRAGIGATGLVEAQSGAKGRFDVSFRYGTSQTLSLIHIFAPSPPKDSHHEEVLSH